MLLPWGSSSQSAHWGTLRQHWVSCESRLLCDDLEKGNVVGEATSALILVGCGVGGSGHTHWSVPALSLLLAAGVQRSWGMWDLSGGPAWEGGVAVAHTRVPMMHTQPCTSQPGCTCQDPAPGTGPAANSPQGSCGSVWSGLNPSPSVHVTRAGTPLC